MLVLVSLVFFLFSSGPFSRLHQDLLSTFLLLLGYCLPPEVHIYELVLLARNALQAALQPRLVRHIVNVCEQV